LLLLVTNLGFMMITFHQFPSPTPSLLGHGSTYLQHLQLCSVCDPAKKKFLTSEFSYLLFFPTPPIQLKLGLQIGGRLLTSSNFLRGPIKLSSQSTAGVRACCCVFYKLPLSKLCKNVGPKPFCWAKSI
jgi:hypothetical protein